MHTACMSGNMFLWFMSQHDGFLDGQCWGRAKMIDKFWGQETEKPLHFSVELHNLWKVVKGESRNTPHLHINDDTISWNDHVMNSYITASKEKGRIKAAGLGPVVVTVMDRERISDYQEIVTELRNAGIRSEVYLGNPKNFGNQLKYADNRRSPAAIIEGTDERESGMIQVKDMILGKKISEEATLEEWKDRPSQFTVRREELVQKIKEILNSYK